MKVRRCQSAIAKYGYCDAGWAMTPAATNSKASCMDEPMEDNCNNIIDTETYKCPNCGKPLENQSLFDRILKSWFGRMKRAPSLIESNVVKCKILEKVIFEILAKCPNEDIVKILKDNGLIILDEGVEIANKVLNS